MATLQMVSVTEEIIDFLASAPTPTQILEYKASVPLQERLRYLLDKNRDNHLTAEENAELDEMEKMNHFIILLKGRIRENLATK